MKKFFSLFLILGFSGGMSTSYAQDNSNILDTEVIDAVPELFQKYKKTGGNMDYEIFKLRLQNIYDKGFSKGIDVMGTVQYKLGLKEGVEEGIKIGYEKGYKKGIGYGAFWGGLFGTIFIEFVLPVCFRFIGSFFKKDQQNILENKTVAN